MVFHRVLSFRRSSRSMDGRVEKSPAGHHGQGRRNPPPKGATPSLSSSSTVTSATNNSVKDKRRRQQQPQRQPPAPYYETQSPVSIRTATTGSPEWSHEGGGGGGSSPDIPTPSIRSPPHRTRRLTTSQLAAASSLAASAENWMRILPLEEKKENCHQQHPQFKGSSRTRAMPPATATATAAPSAAGNTKNTKNTNNVISNINNIRKSRTMGGVSPQVPSIVHAGHPMVPIPRTSQDALENPFEEYEQEDDILLVGRYVRTAPLVPAAAQSARGGQEGHEYDEMLQVMPTSPVASTLPNDDAFSQTIVAGNLIMTSSVLLLSSIVTLSVLKHTDTVVLPPHAPTDNPFLVRPPPLPGTVADTQKFLFAPPAAKTVRDSLQRHIQFHIHRSRRQSTSLDATATSTTTSSTGHPGTWGRNPTMNFADELDDSSAPPRLSPASPVTEDASHSTCPPTHTRRPPLSPSTVHTVVQDCLLANNVGAAISVYQAYLAKQNAMSKSGGTAMTTVTTAGSAMPSPDALRSPSSSFSTPERSHSYYSAVSQSVVDDMDAQKAETLGKLAILSLLAGQNKEALQYAMEANRMHKETTNRPLSIAMATMQLGLIHFATSRAGRALKAWREAMQLCCLAVGYDHPIVAVLLNNIGVLHYDSGDSLAAVRALEESLELQRSMLKSGLGAVHVEHALYQMATTMGNLALALELNERYDRAIELLQEAQSLYESVEGECVTSPGGSTDVSSVVEMAQENLDRLLLLRERFLSRRRNEQSLLQTESNSMGDASTTDGERSITLFGNADGIPLKMTNPCMEMADNHDYLLLGYVAKELTPRQRVREIVLTWFGRASEDSTSVFVERTPFLPFEQVVSRDEEDAIKSKPSESSIKLQEADRSSTIGQPTSPDRNREGFAAEDDSQSAFDAELNLQEIHLEALDHLDHHEIGDALDLFVLALKSHKNKYGEEHHLVGTALHNIGMVHLFAEEYLQAYGIFKEAARIRSIALGPEHPHVASSMIKIGLLQYAAMDIAAASRTFSEVREIYLASMGYAHPHLAKIMNNIGVLRYEEGDFSGATRAFEIAYEYLRRLVEDHPGDSAVAEIAMGCTLANIGFLYHRQDELVSAVRLFEEARATLNRHLFADDPKVMMVQQNIEYLVGKGVDIGAPCEEGCQLTPAARTCLMQFSWRR